MTKQTSGMQVKDLNILRPVEGNLEGSPEGSRGVGKKRNRLARMGGCRWGGMMFVALVLGLGVVGCQDQKPVQRPGVRQPAGGVITHGDDETTCVPGCTPDQTCVNKVCVPKITLTDDGSCEVACKTGFLCQKGACVYKETGKSLFENDGTCTTSCQTGQVCQNGTCISPDMGVCPSCNPPFKCESGRCVPDFNNASFCGGVICNGAVGQRCITLDDGVTKSCILTKCSPECDPLLNQKCVQVIKKDTNNVEHSSWTCKVEACNPECSSDKEVCRNFRCEPKFKPLTPVCKAFENAQTLSLSPTLLELEGNLDGTTYDGGLAGGFCRPDTVDQSKRGRDTTQRYQAFKFTVTETSVLTTNIVEGPDRFMLYVKAPDQCKSFDTRGCSYPGAGSEMTTYLKPGDYFLVPQVVDYTLGTRWKIQAKLEPIPEKCKKPRNTWCEGDKLKYCPLFTITSLECGTDSTCYEDGGGKGACKGTRCSKPLVFDVTGKVPVSKTFTGTIDAYLRGDIEKITGTSCVAPSSTQAVAERVFKVTGLKKGQKLQINTYEGDSYYDRVYVQGSCGTSDACLFSYYDGDRYGDDFTNEYTVKDGEDALFITIHRESGGRASKYNYTISVSE